MDKSSVHLVTAEEIDNLCKEIECNNQNNSNLTSWPRLLLTGPKKQEYDNNLCFDSEGKLIWEHFTLSRLLGTDRAEEKVSELESFFFATFKLHSYSKSISTFWNNITHDQFVQNYEQVFPCLHAEPASILRFFTLFKRSMNPKRPRPEISMVVSRILSTLLERLLTFPFNITAIESKLDSKMESVSSKFTASSSSPPLSQFESNDLYSSTEIQKSVKMRILLNSPQLLSRLGKDKIFLLKLLVGPLHGLNLRNLLWHGFISPDEYPSFLTGLLFGIVLTIALEMKSELLSEKYQIFLKENTSIMSFFDPFLVSTSPEFIKLFPNIIPISYNQEISSQVETSKKSFSNSITSSSSNNCIDSKTFDTNDNNFCSILQAEKQEILEFVKRSKFVSPQSLSEWELAIDLMCENYSYEALVVLFPLFENVLRQIFVEENNIPSFRLAAESDTLVVSLDLILDVYLGNEMVIQEKRQLRRQQEESVNKLMSYSDLKRFWENFHWDSGEETLIEVQKYTENESTETAKKIIPKRNLMFDKFPLGLCNALFDIFVWSNTFNMNRYYRIRDQLAHGSISPSGISVLSTCHTFLILLTTLDFSPQNSNSTILNSIQPLIKSYIPCFHRKRGVLYSLQMTISKLEDFSSQYSSLSNHEMAHHLMLNAISKELSVKEKEIQKECIKLNEKLKIDLKQLEHLTSLCKKLNLKLNSNIKDSDSGDILKGVKEKDPTKLVKYVSPLTPQALNQFFAVWTCTEYINEMIAHLKEIFASTHAELISREAWKHVRMRYFRLSLCIPNFILMIQIVLKILEEILYHPEMAPTVDLVWKGNRSKGSNFITFVCSTLSMMLAKLKSSLYIEAQDIFVSFFAPNPRFPTNTNGSKENWTLWLNYPEYLNRLTYHSRGLELKTFYYFDPPALVLQADLDRERQSKLHLRVLFYALMLKHNIEF